MKRPEQSDDKYYPFSIPESKEWFINDLEIYCDYIEEKLHYIQSISNVLVLDQDEFMHLTAKDN